MTCARREAGAHRPVPSTSTGSPRKPDARTGRARARLLGLLPALALLLGALGLFAAAPAQAQTTIWSATLTVDVDDIYAGCDDDTSTHDNCSSSTVLTDNSFTRNQATFQIKSIYVELSGSDQGKLTLVVSNVVRSLEIPVWVLHVGNSEFALADATADPNGKIFSWASTGLSWSDGQTVALKLVDTSASPPTSVTLSVDNANPAEGETVTVTAELDQPALEDYRVFLNVGTAVNGVSTTVQAGDHGLVGAISIAAGGRTGTTTIPIR